MTTLSLLPHHHHDCSESICLMPGYCGHDDSECGHSHNQDNNANSHSEDHCSLRVVDMSAAKSAELQIVDVQSIVLYLCCSHLTDFIKDELVGVIRVAQLEGVLSQLKCPSFGLRAPPKMV